MLQQWVVHPSMLLVNSDFNINRGHESFEVEFLTGKKNLEGHEPGLSKCGMDLPYYLFVLCGPFIITSQFQSDKEVVIHMEHSGTIPINPTLLPYSNKPITYPAHVCAGTCNAMTLTNSFPGPESGVASERVKGRACETSETY